MDVTVREIALDDPPGLTGDVKWAEINATAAGDTQVVAAVTGKKIRAVGWLLVCSVAVGVAWKSGAGTTLINAMSFATNGGISAANYGQGYAFETAVSGALVINLSGIANVRGSLCYVEV